MNNMEIKVSVKDIPEVIEQLEKAEKSINNLEQENKQLKEELENIKDFNNKLQASKDRLDKDDYNLAHILTELEEWLNTYKSVGYEDIGTFQVVLNKIQELKEKYK